ncbi:hypothetical protein HJFPF1_07043 [Paramyrothecium foliicola]|nr:hypothetical protein HJFPF1_07043 [Paramyrothecium foliicola]
MRIMEQWEVGPVPDEYFFFLSLVHRPSLSSAWATRSPPHGAQANVPNVYPKSHHVQLLSSPIPPHPIQPWLERPFARPGATGKRAMPVYHHRRLAMFYIALLCRGPPGLQRRTPPFPVPRHLASSSLTAPPNRATGPPQADMARRNDRMDFPGYGAPQPGMTPQQHHQHPTPVQPPMNVPQQPRNAAQQSQQQTPIPTPAQPARQRKRPAPSSAPPPATAPPAAPVTPAQVQAPVAGPPTAQPVGTPAQPQPVVDDATATPTSQPPAKKNRTNTPWTPQEELRLKQMRDAGNSWAEIAKRHWSEERVIDTDVLQTFPTRTEGSVKKHWYKSQALLNAIKEYENNKWKVIGQKVGKPAKACEQYAKEHFPGMMRKNSSMLSK